MDCVCTFVCVSSAGDGGNNEFAFFLDSTFNQSKKYLEQQPLCFSHEQIYITVCIEKVIQIIS